MVSQPPGRTHHNALIDLGGMANHHAPSPSVVSSYGGPLLGLPANAPLHYPDFLTGDVRLPSQIAPLVPGSSVGMLTPDDIDSIKGIAARVSALEREPRDMTAGFHGVGQCYLRLQDEVGDVYEIGRAHV